MLHLLFVLFHHILGTRFVCWRCLLELGGSVIIRLRRAGKLHTGVVAAHRREN